MKYRQIHPSRKTGILSSIKCLLAFTAWWSGLYVLVRMNVQNVINDASIWTALLLISIIGIMIVFSAIAFVFVFRRAIINIITNRDWSIQVDDDDVLSWHSPDRRLGNSFSVDLRSVSELEKMTVINGDSSDFIEWQIKLRSGEAIDIPADSPFDMNDLKYHLVYSHSIPYVRKRREHGKEIEEL